MLYFLFWQMILVAIFGKTGFFDYVALKVRRTLCTNECYKEDFHWLLDDKVCLSSSLISLINSFNVLQPFRANMLFSQPIGSKTKTNRNLAYARAFSRACSPRLAMGQI